MLAARFSTLPLTAFVTTLSRPSAISAPRTLQCALSRQLATQGRTTGLRRVKTATLRERLSAPAGDGGMWLHKHNNV